MGKDHRIVPRTYLFIAVDADFRNFTVHSVNMYGGPVVSDTGLGLDKQTKAWSLPKRDSSNDRFSRSE